MRTIHVTKVQKHTVMINDDSILIWGAVDCLTLVHRLTLDANRASTGNDQPTNAVASSLEPYTKDVNRGDRIDKQLEEYVVSRIVRHIKIREGMHYVVR